MEEKKKIMRKMQKEEEGIVRGTIFIDTRGGGAVVRIIYYSEFPSTVPARPSSKYNLEARYNLRN